MFRTSLLTAFLAASVALPVAAQTPAPAFPNTTNPYLRNVPAPAPNIMTLIPRGTGTMANFTPWAMTPAPTAEQKRQLMQAMMPMMSNLGLNIRDVMNYMTTKYKADAGLSFDEVVESMKLRANQLNFKLVGHSPMIKDIQAVLGDTTTPRMEVFHFCDIAAGREVMRLVPEAIVFLPCRIAVMEDDQKNVWVLTLDWDMAWLNSINGSMGITPELAKMAIEIRDKMDNIMRAAAKGDL